MKELIHHEPLLNINSQTHKEKTALHVLLVKMSSSPKMLDFVMDQAFEPSLTVDEDGWTVLFFAAVLGSIDLCRSLLIKGARADVKDVFGNYPFVYALVAHNFPCATVLVHQLMHRFPRRWVSDLSSLDNISVIERKVKSVFKVILG
jgi:ankyrin repeat protein